MRHFLRQALTIATRPATIGSTTPPAAIDPIRDASVRPGVRWAASQASKCRFDEPIDRGVADHVGEQVRRSDRACRDQQQASERRDEEDEHGMESAEGRSELVGGSVRRRVEHGYA